MDSLGKDTGVGSHSLLQGIFPSQGSNPGLLHCRQILYHLNYESMHSIDALILLRPDLIYISHTHTHTPKQNLNEQKASRSKQVSKIQEDLTKTK